MTGTDPTVKDDLDVARRVKQMRDEDLVDFIRDTVGQLEVLADRLEAKIGREDVGDRRRGAGSHPGHQGA